MPAVPILTCPAAIVHDGDTLRCPGGPLLRLARIDAAEMPGSPKCRRPGPHTDCDARRATRSRDNLARLVAAGPLRCRVVDASPDYPGFQSRDRYGRRVVRCRVNGVDLGDAQRAGGFARAWPLPRL